MSQAAQVLGIAQLQRPIIPVTAATVGEQTEDVELGVENMRRVTSSRTSRSIGSAEIFQQLYQGFDHDDNGRNADLQQGGACYEDYVVLVEVLDIGTSPVGKLGGRKPGGQHRRVPRDCHESTRASLGSVLVLKQRQKKTKHKHKHNLTRVVSLSTRHPTRPPSAFIVAIDVGTCRPASHV